MVKGGLHALKDRIFYAAGSVGIIFDYKTNQQESLRGHCNKIESSCMSSNGRWIATSDVGKDSLIIIWDTKKEAERNDSVIPIKVIADSHGGYGAKSVSFSTDSKWLFSLGADPSQTICIWNWTESSEPIHTIEISINAQVDLRVNPTNNFEFLTFGPNEMMFYNWDETDGIKKSSPILNESHLEYKMEHINLASFFFYDQNGLNQQAIAVLDKGDVAIFQNRNFVNLQKKLPDGQRAVLQHSKLQSSSITFIDIINVSKDKTGELSSKFIITGSQSGQIYVYDMELKLMWWYNVAKSCSVPFCGAIEQIAFDFFSEDKKFPDLIVMTNLGQIFHITAQSQEVQSRISEHSKKAKKQRLNVELADPVVSIAIQASTKCLVNFPFASLTCSQVSPTEPWIYFAGDSGFLQIWNTENHKLVKSISVHLEEKVNKPFQKEQITKLSGRMPIKSLAINSDGSLLVVAIKDPHCTYLFYDAKDFKLLQTLVQYPDTKTASHIYSMTFSEGDKYIAAIDSNHGTTVLKKEGKDWTVLGKVNAHHAPVICKFSLILATIFLNKRIGENNTFKKQNFPTLYTFCQDGFAIEYNVNESHLTSGLVITGIRQIERFFSPTSCAIQVEQTQDDEHPRLSVLIANSDFKIRSLNADTLFVRKTCLGPGALYGLLTKMLVLGGYMVYATDQRVVGLIKLPIDGNMYKSMGMISHASEINHLLLSSNKRNVISISENIVHTWKLDLESFEQQITLPAPDPFMEILESEASPGKSRYKEMEDYFYYIQIKEQGEKSKEHYKVKSAIPIKFIPDIMRAMGFYPSEWDIENMINEVRFSLVNISGQLKDEIDMKGLVQLYVNHKPVVIKNSEQELEDAISKITEIALNGDDSGDQLAQIKRYLAEHGEAMGLEEFNKLMSILEIKADDSLELSKELGAAY